MIRIFDSKMRINPSQTDPSWRVRPRPWKSTTGRSDRQQVEMGSVDLGLWSARASWRGLLFPAVVQAFEFGAQCRV